MKKPAKPRYITIKGKQVPIAEAKKRRDQIMKGFAIGAFTKERHAERWKEYEEIHESLSKANCY